MGRHPWRANSEFELVRDIHVDTKGNEKKGGLGRAN